MLGHGPLASRPLSGGITPPAPYTLFSWPMMWLGSGVPPTFVDTDAGNAEGVMGADGESNRIYSDNPVLALAEFISNPAYGRGETPNWTSVAECADIADEMIGSPAEKRRLIGLVIDRQTDVDSVEETLRGYAGVFIHREGGEVHFIPDAVAEPVVAFTQGSYLIESIEIAQRGAPEMPTVVTIHYTNTTVTPWADATVRLKAAGVDAGSVPWRETNLYYPGIQRNSEAHRMAVRYLNEYTLGDLTVVFNAPDLALHLRRGEVFSLTDGEGFIDKPFRLIEMEQYEPGRYRISGSEYQPGYYSDDVQTAPTIPDTGLPSPNSPTPITGLAMVEEVYQEQTIGGYLSRFKVTWAESSFPFVAHYRVSFIDLTDGAGNEKVIDTATVKPGLPEYRTPPVQQSRSYRADVSVVSSTGVESAVVSDTKTAEGKALIPSWGAGAALTGIELGGEVILSWPAAVDLDVTLYEVRYGTTSQTWDQATLIDRINALTTRIRGVAAGTWRFFVKALDSVRNSTYPYGQETATAITTDLTVTSDLGAFSLQNHQFTTPTLTNMFGWVVPGDTLTTYVTNFAAATWNSTFTSTMNSYTNPLFTYGGSGTSALETESWDIGIAISGNINAVWDVYDISGTSTKKIRVSLDGTNWTDFTGAVAKATFRYVRLRVETTGRMRIKGSPAARVDVVPREESQVATSSNSGPKLITLNNIYFSAVNITVQPQGNGAASLTGLYDQVALYPEAGEAIYLEATMTESGANNEYVFLKIDSPGYVVSSGEYLWWDSFAIDDPATSGLGDGGVDIYFTDGTYLRLLGGVDQDAVNTSYGNANAYRAWYTRKVSLTPAAGKQISGVAICLRGEASVAAKHRALFRNINIKNGNGGGATVNQAIWNSGVVANRTVLNGLQNGASNIICNRNNGFDIYVLNASNTKQQVECYVNFKGV
jgi:hypothetical protein